MVGGIPPPPLGFFLHDSKIPYDIEKKLSDFNFTPLTVILDILPITIVSNQMLPWEPFVFSVLHHFLL